VNGYQTLDTAAAKTGEIVRRADAALDRFVKIGRLAADKLCFAKPAGEP